MVMKALTLLENQAPREPTKCHLCNPNQVEPKAWKTLRVLRHLIILVFMFEKILIATDGSKHSEKAATAAIELSQLTKGKITAIYVEDRDKKGIEATERIREMAGKAGIPFEAKIVEGNPANEILKFAEDAKMDVIVIGSIGVTGLKKFMIGSVAEKVVLHSKVPVLTVY